VKDKKPLQDALRETWMSALGVLSSAESELLRVTSRLTEMLGHPAEEAQHLAQELQIRVRKNRALLERRVEESVRLVAERMRLPLAGEIADLRARLERASARLEEQLERRRRRAGANGLGKASGSGEGSSGSDAA